MYGHTLQGGRIFTAIVCTILAQKKVLKSHINFCFKTNGKQMIQIPKEGENSKIMKRNHHIL